MTDLSAPLTRRRDRRREAATAVRRSIPVGRIGVGILVALVLVVIGWTVLVDDPDGGRPAATVAITQTRPVNPVAGANATAGPSPSIIVEGEFPVTPENDTPAEPAPQPELLATAEPGQVLADLVEQTEFGPIPRISTTGLRPFDAYARPTASPAAGGTPRVAIFVSGLGINHGGTMDAIAQLPAEVTLGFAPYGKSLEEAVSAARGAGHEIFLEVPLEPFDYPENDPGPDTLLTGTAPRDNLQRLFKVMSRFGGYAGVMNNMGARFTASSADFGPVMEQLASAGLGYIDDGSSNRSLAAQLADANAVPFARVDGVLDLDPSQAAIRLELDKLVELARKQGSAIGLVSALPVSINTVTEWASALDGVELVPASALMKDPNG